MAHAHSDTWAADPVVSVVPQTSEIRITVGNAKIVMLFDEAKELAAALLRTLESVR